MEIIDVEKKDLEAKFNSSDDYSILILLNGSDLSVDDKKYLIDHCQERINQMDIEIFLQTIRQTDQEFCERCSQYLSSKIQSLTVTQIEKLLYVNKYYHEVSKIAEFLLKQNWFQLKKEKEYKTFFIAYELEKLLKMKSVDKQKMVDFGIDIVNQLTLTIGEPMLFDMVIKNYLFLLEKYNFEYYEEFKKHGYDILNQQIANNKELTPNMIIFDCGITKIDLGSNIMDYFEFYEKENEKTFAYAHAGTVRINVATIKKNYLQYKNKKTGSQMLLYVIGHEIDHVFCERFKCTENYANNNLITELKVFNSGISSALQELDRSFYLEYHNCFAHEFAANVQGIKTLYQKQKNLPSITKEDKEEINQLLAQILLSSYCLVEDNSIEYGYVGPVEFTRGNFKNFKDNLPGYARHCLLNNQTDLPNELELIEKNLNEEEKFLLGYYNKFIGILELIADGKITSTNLFKDLPILYNKYQNLVEGKFLPYLTNANDIRKK